MFGLFIVGFGVVTSTRVVLLVLFSVDSGVAVVVIDAVVIAVVVVVVVVVIVVVVEDEAVACPTVKTFHSSPE